MNTTVIDDTEPRTARERAPSDFALRPVATIAAFFVTVEIAVAARYGLHRDELYFLACGRHLAWGYVDQPPLVPAIARVSSALLGAHAWSLRLLPAMAGGATVVLAALVAHELRGGSRAQTFAALATALSPVILGAAHLLSTATFDIFFWALLSWLVVRWLRTAEAWLWPTVGATAGVALLNKWNVLFLLGALAVGIANVPEHRRRLWLPRTLIAPAIALLIWSPNLVWNARHDWAAIAMLHSLHTENSTLGASLGFIPLQLLVVGPFLAFLWINGVLLMRRHPIGRVLAVAFVVLVCVDVVSGAKPYYLAGAYPALFAAGGLWYEQRLATRSPIDGHRRARRTAILLIATTAIAVPVALPVLPVTALPTGSWEGGINKDLSATVAWDDVVRQIAKVAHALPPTDRAHIVVFTGDYGAAGAVDEFGARYGLPHAISGHNNYWWWGPGDARDGATTIAVNLDHSYLATIFDSITPAGTVTTPHNVWTEERGAPIFVCRQEHVSWRAAWPHARDYG